MIMINVTVLFATIRDIVLFAAVVLCADRWGHPRQYFAKRHPMQWCQRCKYTALMKSCERTKKNGVKIKEVLWWCVHHIGKAGDRLGCFNIGGKKRGRDVVLIVVFCVIFILHRAQILSTRMACMHIFCVWSSHPVYMEALVTTHRQ